MPKNLIIVLLLIPALACSLNRGADELAATPVSLEAELPTPVPSPTDLPVIEDIERLKQEAPQPTATLTPRPTTSSQTDTVTQPVSPQNLGTVTDDNDRENDNTRDNQAGDIVAVQSTVTLTPSPAPTATPSPTPTASSIAPVGGWPPILPDAANLDTGAGYVIYQTGTNSADITDFYRREMAAQGWAEIDFNALFSELPAGVEGLSPSIVDGGGTVLSFSQDGGQTLFFAVIFDNGHGQAGVQLVWIAD